MTCGANYSPSNSSMNSIDFQITNVQSKNSSKPKPKFETRRVLNPAFFTINPTRQPIFQHILNDKITDAERSAKIALGVSVATAPFLGKLSVSSPQGFLVSTIIRGAISFPIIHYSNIADQYRDLIEFGTTGKIYGYSIFGQKTTEVI